MAEDKSNRKPLVIGLLAGLAVGYAGGLIWSDDLPVEDASDATTVAPVKAAVSDVGAASSLTALRQRIRELEAQLAARVPPPPATNAPPQTADGPHGGPHPPFSRHLAELKEKDPARYAQITNNMARFRMHRLARAERRLETLAALDTSRWSEEARRTHEQYQNLLARREELMEAMRPDDDTVTEEARRKSREEMHQIHRQLRALEEAERTQLLSATAEGFGLTGTDAKELVETVRAVWETTSDNRGGPPPGPPPGGR